MVFHSVSIFHLEVNDGTTAYHQREDILWKYEVYFVVQFIYFFMVLRSVFVERRCKIWKRAFMNIFSLLLFCISLTTRDFHCCQQAEFYTRTFTTLGNGKYLIYYYFLSLTSRKKSLFFFLWAPYLLFLKGPVTHKDRL